MSRTLRTLGLVGATSLVAVGVASPASALFHDKVHDQRLHAVLDLLTFAVVALPVLTAWLWGGTRRGWMVALIAVVQIPVAVFGFVPIGPPLVHLAAFLAAFALTGASVWYTRRATESVPAGVSEPR